MNDDDLLKQYRILLAKNKALLKENEILKARLGIIDTEQLEPPQEHEESFMLDFASTKPPIIQR